VLIRKARKTAQAYYRLYQEHIPVAQLCREVAAVMQEFTRACTRLCVLRARACAWRGSAAGGAYVIAAAAAAPTDFFSTHATRSSQHRPRQAKLTKTNKPTRNKTNRIGRRAAVWRVAAARRL
jgi:hypothetical protein